MTRRKRPETRQLVWIGTHLALLACLVCGCGGEQAKKNPPAAAVKPEPEAELPEIIHRDPAEVVVAVDGTTLTQGKLDHEVTRMLTAQGGQMSPDREQQMRKMARERVIEGFIAETVLLNEAQRRNIQVEEPEVQKAISEIQGQAPAGTTLETILQMTGMSEKEFRERLTSDLKIEKLLDVCTAELPQATDEEIQAFYAESRSEFEQTETVHARHVLIKCDSQQDPIAREGKKLEAENIRKKLLDGEDFASLAAGHSDCPSKERGGDLGTFERGQMVKPFEEAAFSQKVNEIGPVIETDFGFHIIEVLAHNAAGTTPLTEVRDKIAAHLKKKTERAAIGKYLKELQDKAKITYATE
ncbi:MAG: peptidylprolyl isomerase [Kiritimatiellae bacterium]|nr:peptidylprolyl isomerase [Kiritimatiellia bacterium]